MKGDTPITRVMIDQMSLEDMEAHLDGIRTRRLKAVRVYEESQALANTVAVEQLRVAVMKSLDQAAKTLARWEKIELKFRSLLLEACDVRIEPS